MPQASRKYMCGRTRITRFDWGSTESHPPKGYASLSSGGAVKSSLNMNAPLSPYEKLRSRAKEVALVDSAAALLNWDEETYMPRQALPFRAEQLAFFSGWSHRQFTSSEVGDWIKACEDHGFAPDSD